MQKRRLERLFQRFLAYSGEEGIIFLDQTNFYAEAGGQVGDHGHLVTEDGAVFQVLYACITYTVPFIISISICITSGRGQGASLSRRTELYSRYYTNVSINMAAYLRVESSYIIRRRGSHYRNRQTSMPRLGSGLGSGFGSG